MKTPNPEANIPDPEDNRQLQALLVGAQERSTFWILAGAGAAIGYALDKSPGIEHSLILAAVLAWGGSVGAGLMYSILTRWNLSTNFAVLEVIRTNPPVANVAKEVGQERVKKLRPFLLWSARLQIALFGFASLLYLLGRWRALP